MEDEVDVPDELVAVATWRIEKLTEAGCDPDMAGLLAASGADYHRAVDMAARGCEWHMIVKILA